jgi:hypothetical protein
VLDAVIDGKLTRRTVGALQGFAPEHVAAIERGITAIGDLLTC